MKYFNILFVLLIMLSCRNSEKKRELVEVNFHNNSIDSVSSDKFFKKNKLEYFLQGLDTLHPRCIDWGKDRHVFEQNGSDHNSLFFRLIYFRNTTVDIPIAQIGFHCITRFYLRFRRNAFTVYRGDGVTFPVQVFRRMYRNALFYQR